MNYTQTTKSVDEISPGDLISIGGPVYEIEAVEKSTDMVNDNEVWLHVVLISVLPNQPTQVDFEANLTLPKNLMVNVLK